MHKILLIISHGLPQHLLDFASGLNTQQPINLVAIFLDPLQRVDKDAYLFPSDINATETDYTKATDKEEATSMLNNRIKFYEDYCNDNNIQHKARSIKSNFLESIIDETAFADYVFCNTELNEEMFSLSAFLSSAHCPVLLIPENASVTFKQVVFTFDGHMSSIHAMKQFTYLFSSLKHVQVSLVTVLPTNTFDMEYDILIREWLSVHYPEASINLLTGQVKDSLPEFINQHQDCITVMGAFGRNALSKLFRDSLVPTILNTTNCPLFISHT